MQPEAVVMLRLPLKFAVPPETLRLGVVVHPDPLNLKLRLPLDCWVNPRCNDRLPLEMLMVPPFVSGI